MTARRSTAPRWALVFLLAFATVACDRCGACGSSDAVASVAEASGTVEHDGAGEGERWNAAAVGAAVSMGEAVRTRSASTAVLKMTKGGSRLEMGEDTLVRFLRTRPDADIGIDVRAGEAMLLTGDEEVRFETRFGLATIQGRSGVALRGRDDDLEIAVRFGLASIQTDEGLQEIEEGATMRVSFGAAELVVSEPDPEEAPEAVADAGVAPDEASAGSGAGAATAVIAEVRRGAVQVQAPGESRFRTLGRGEIELAPETRVRATSRAQIALRRGGERTTLTGPFDARIGAPSAPILDAQRGSIAVESNAGTVAVAVPGGTIVVRGDVAGGSAGAADVRGGSTSVRVERGEIEVRGPSGAEVLREGETAALTAQGDVEVGGRGPAFAHFGVAAGESFTVRDPSPPTAIAFRFGEHCTTGVVELLRGSRVVATSRGERSANLLVPAGRHGYRLRCQREGGLEREAAASGNVTVTRDAGRAPLPRTPPSSFVDTDGRAYEVLYQNVLPSITVRWPDAPRASGYVLRAGSETFRAREPTHEIPSGALREGRHVLVFATADGSRSSRPTPLVIGFDNAAPTAMLRQPENGAFDAGGTIDVSGVALEGWSVHVGGVALPIDQQRRFQGSVQVPAGERGIAIRLSHPRRGVQYYVRRPRGADR